MEKKYWRVVAENVNPTVIYNTDTLNYGSGFGTDRFGYFLSVYGKIMDQVNLPVDFLINVNNNIFLMGEMYLDQLNNAFDSSGNIVLSKVSAKPEYYGYRMPVELLSEFLQSFDELNPFEFFESGPHLWEFYLEKVRAQNFRGYPSRLSSVFFFTNYEDCKNYCNRSVGEIKEVEILDPKNMLEFDMQIIDDIPTTISRNDLYKKLRGYWNGEMTDKPLVEVVYQGKYRFVQ